MKKCLLLISALLLVLALCACAGSKTDTKSSSGSASETETEKKDKLTNGETTLYNIADYYTKQSEGTISLNTVSLGEIEDIMGSKVTPEKSTTTGNLSYTWKAAADPEIFNTDVITFCVRMEPDKRVAGGYRITGAAVNGAHSTDIIAWAKNNPKEENK